MKMTTIVINKGEALSMVFEGSHLNGRITKTKDAYKLAFDALKKGIAEKTCDTETTLMYNVK